MLDTLDIICSVASGLSFLACIWLFRSYKHIHPQRRSIALEMILILGVANFIQALTSFILLLVRENEVLCVVVQYITSFSTLYSLFWSSALAIFSAKGMKAPQESQAKFKRFFYMALMICFIMGMLLPLPIAINLQEAGYSDADGPNGCKFHFNDNKATLLSVLLIQVGPYVMAISITLIEYIRVGLAVKTTSSTVLTNWMINPKYLMWYPISQLVLYVPYLIAGTMYAFGSDSEFLEKFWRILIRLTGFVNSIVYLKMRRTIRKTKPSLPTSEKTTPFLETNLTGNNDSQTKGKYHTLH